MSDSILFRSFHPAGCVGDVHKPGRSLGAFLAAAALWMSAIAWAQDAPTVAIAPGVVADGSTQQLYLLEPEGLTARVIDSGERVWALDGVIEPLGVNGGQLLALRAGSAINLAELLVIDTERGSIVRVEALVFPDEVRVRLIEGPGERFQARLLHSAGGMQLAWDYSRHPLKGAPAVSGANRPPKMPRQTGLMVEGDPRQDSAADDSDQPMAARVELSTYRSGVIELAWTRSDSVSSATRDAVPTVEGLIWRELQGADRLSGSEGRQFVSASAGATLVSARQESAGATGPYRWTVLDAQAQPIGQFEAPYAFAPFARIDRRLAYVAHPRIHLEAGRVIESQELAVIVIDLADGREAWQAALLDKAWREGMPP